MSKKVFKVGTPVFVQFEDAKIPSVAGEVTEALPEERAYRVKLEDGRAVRVDAKNVSLQAAAENASA